jgi:hypothetical protein
MSQSFTKGTPIDTDSTLSLNSDIVVPSQKAIKTYISLINIDSLSDVTISSAANGDTLEYNGTTWINSGIKWTVELVSATTVDVYAPYNLKISSVTNILNAPTTTIQDDGVSYTVGGGSTIASGSKITVTVNTASVITLNIIKA